MNKPTPSFYHPDTLDEMYTQTQGPVSLPFSLFRLAPPEVALRMMEDGLITDLNEKSGKNVSLLGVKAVSLAPRCNVPTYDALKEDKEAAWEEANQGKVGINQVVLLTSMIMSGADPWSASWDPKDYDHRHSNLFSLVVSVASNPSFLNFLLTHPNCPSAEELQKNRVVSKMCAESWNAGTTLDQAPLLHVLANAGYDEALTLLLKKGFDVNEVDEHGRHALFYVQSSSTAKILIQNGANVHLKDSSGRTVAQMWKRTFSTAAKQSEMNKILIDEMKSSMTPDEIREAQKPQLFNEVLKGTKTSFEGIYRKAKFEPSVTLEMNGLHFNIITAALRRNDEKTPIFLNWAHDKKVSWTHELWENQEGTLSPMNNALYSVALLSNKGMGYDEPRRILQDCYTQSQDAIKDLYNDLMHMSLKLVRSGTGFSRTLNWLVGHDRYEDDMRNNRNEYHVGYGLVRFKNFLRQAHIITQTPLENDKAPPAPLYSVSQHPLYHSLLQESCKSMVKNALATLKAQKGSSYLNLRTVFQEDLYQVLRTKFYEQVHSDSQAKTSLAWLIMLGYASNYTERNSYNKVDMPLFKQRLDDLETLKTWGSELNLHGDDFALISDFLSAYQDRTKDHQPSTENAQAIFAAIDLSKTVNHLDQAQSAPVSPRRKM